MSQTPSTTASVPGLARTAQAFGSLEQALKVRKALEGHAPELSVPALRLFDADRGRIFRFWPGLTPSQRLALLQQIAGLDLDLLERNLALLSRPDTLASRTAGELSPPVTLRPDEDPGREEVLASGEEVLRKGWLGIVEGAGGTGSRFFKAGGDLPKGLYRISPTQQYNFFELRVARLIALRRRYQKPIPYLVMVSDATEQKTVEFFEKRGYFGLEDEIRIVRQRSLPYIEEVAPGVYDLVLEVPWKVAVGGYGHADFTKHVLLRPDVQKFLARFGTRYVQWLQIDNPLAAIAPRYLLGAHRQAEEGLNPEALAMSFISLEKVVATEAAGVLVKRGGGLAVWEYSDMDPVSMHLLEDGQGEVKVGVSRNGEALLVAPEARQEGDTLLGLPALPPTLRAGLRYRWGAINPNLVLVSLKSVLAHPEDNPPLVAKKSCVHVDEQGNVGDPARKFLKFEAFLFDGLNDGVVVEARRESCFAPTKNATGEVDSPSSARILLIGQAAERLRALGWTVDLDGGTLLELTGLLELTDGDLAARVGRNGRIEAGATLSVEGLEVSIGDGLWLKAGSSLRIQVGGGNVRAPLEVPPRVGLPPGTVVEGTLVLPT